MRIAAIDEHEFVEHSYGFRPQRSCRDALKAVDQYLKARLSWVVDADMKAYFDSIPHTELMMLVKQSISDGRVLALLEAYLEQDILDGLERWTLIMETPQGALCKALHKALSLVHC